MDQQKPENASDLASLRADFSPPPLPTQVSMGRGLADMAMDALIPIMIFCMMLSITWFLLDVRFVYTEELDLNMRTFAFFFVMGIVALNRLQAEQGVVTSSIYMTGMILAVGVFTLVSQAKGGGIAGGHLGSMIPSLLLNIAAVGILWKVTDRLTRDCCVDASSRAGDEGILRMGWPRKKTPPPLPVVDPAENGDSSKAAALRPPRKHPANSLFYLAIPILLMLAIGQRILPQGGAFLTSAGSVYVGIYAASMLMLLLLSSYRGLRVYCEQKKIEFPTHIAAFWLGLGTVMVLLVLILGLWGPVPTTPERAQHLARSYGSGGRTISDRWDYHEHQRSDGTGASAQSDGQERQSGEADGEGGGEHDPDGAEGSHEGPSEGEGGGQSGGAEGQQESQGEGQGAEQGEGERSSEDGGAQRAEDRSGEQSSSNRSGPSPRAEIPMNQMMADVPILKWLGYGALIVVGLFVLYMLIQGAAHVFGNLARGRSRLAGLFERLARLFRRMTYVPKRRPRRARIKIDHDIATCAQYNNPLDGPLSIREKIQYSYDALCAMAYDLGVPRNEDQTPFEFLENLPEPIADIREEAHVLTYLYVAGSYSTLEIPDTVVDDLRAFWRRFEGMRSKVLR